MITCSAPTCTESAPVVVDGVPLCRKHALETLAARERDHKLAKRSVPAKS